MIRPGQQVPGYCIPFEVRYLKVVSTKVHYDPLFNDAVCHSM
jgi:hypothetical protein